MGIWSMAWKEDTVWSEDDDDDDDESDMCSFCIQSEMNEKAYVFGLI